MPNCCIPGCSNRTTKGKVYMASFPSNPERRKVWIHNIGMANWEPNKHSCVCEDHTNEFVGTQPDVIVDASDHRKKQKDSLGSNVSDVTLLESSNFIDTSISSHVNETCNKVDEVKWLKEEVQETNKKLELANKYLDAAKLIFEIAQNNWLRKLKRSTAMRINRERKKKNLKSSLKKLLFNTYQIKVLMNQ